MRALGHRDGALLALVGLILLSLGMRSPTSSLTPIFALVDGDLALGPVVLGLIGAMPPFGFAAAGLLAPAIARRIGVEATLLVAIGALAVGQLGRALAPEPATVVVGTAVTMVGIGVGNVTLPTLVKRYFPTRIGLLTGLYTTLFTTSATVGALSAAPLAAVVGWRGALASGAVTVVLAAVPWLALARRARRPVAVDPLDGASDAAGLADLTDQVDHAAVTAPVPVIPRLRRSRIAWALAVVMLASAVTGYAGSGWLPYLVTTTAGVDATTAGALLAILLGAGVFGALLTPLLAARARAAAVLIATAGVSSTVGWLGLLLAPAAAPALWALLVGLGGTTFPVVLAQIGLRTSTPRSTMRLSAFVQSFAYVATGVTVLAMGILHEVTDGWLAPIALVLVVAVLPIPAAVVLRSAGRVDDPR